MNLRLTMVMVIVWMAILQGPVVCAGQEQAETTDEDIAQMVEQLTDGSPLQRREATERLVKLGERAVTPLAVAAETEVIEDSQACFDVLARLRISDDAKTAESAKESLERLSKSEMEHVARRAKTVLRLNDLLRQRAAKAAAIPGPNANGGNGVGIQIAVDVNGRRQIQVSNGDERVQISDANGKDIRVKRTRMVDGKLKTDEYQGTDLDDLRKKHPDAAKLYEKSAGGRLVVAGQGNGIQIQIGGGVGAPAPVPPNRLPGFPVPIPLNGADEIADEPGEPRTIRVEKSGRKIEIVDIRRKHIRVKITEIGDGKEVTQEYSADDPRTLKANHPEIGKLYEQYAGRSTED